MIWNQVLEDGVAFPQEENYSLPWEASFVHNTQYDPQLGTGVW